MPNKYKQDPGHGGTDPGAVSHGNIEKIYTLEAGIYVDRRLGDHGITSTLTRIKDVTLDSGPRTANVRNSGVQRCLSHHFNAGGGTGAEFIHSIWSNPTMENILADEFRKAGLPLRPRPVYDRKWGSDDYYYMHRETGSVVTTIIEYEFVDGPNADKIKSKAYREKMYEAVVKAVCRFEGVKYKPLNEPKPTPKPKPKPKEEEEMLEKAIVINSFADFPVAESVAKNLKAPIYMRSTAEKKEVAKEVIVIGGNKNGLKGNKFTVLSGGDRFETAAKVAKYLK